jgi:hypothetical protein
MINPWIGREMNMGFWRTVLATFAILLPVITIARAHDHEHPELNGWYESLHSGKGHAAMAAMRSALTMPIGKAETVTIACVSMASGLMFRMKLSWTDRTALAARWFGLTMLMVIRKRAALCRGPWDDVGSLRAAGLAIVGVIERKLAHDREAIRLLPGCALRHSLDQGAPARPE